MEYNLINSERFIKRVLNRGVNKMKNYFQYFI